jgi:hypothetical protein
MTNKYKLTKYDFALLFPIMTPYEIKEEFGDRCGAVRTIYKSLEKISDRTAKAERDRLIQNFISNRSINQTKEEVQHYVDQALKEARVYLISEIWERVEQFEGRHN